MQKNKRKNYQAGGPVEAQAVPMETDTEVEVNAIAGLLSNSTTPEEREYLFEALGQDPQLASILDNVLTYASEESGEGLVEGGTPGATDSIAARVDEGEFIFPTAAVEVIGVEVLQEMMDQAMAQAESGPQQEGEPPRQMASRPSTPASPSLLERGPATP